jgi:cytochrome bd-type quinol oxidase subunit 2
MSAEVVAWLAVLASFSLYGVLSGVELAVALMRVEPRLAPARPARRIFTPRWEVTNVLLVLGVAGLAVLSRDALAAVFEATWPVLTVGLAALIIRAGLLTFLFLHKEAPGWRAPNYVFALVSLVVPLSLGAAGIYMATGEAFWLSGTGMALFAALVAGLLALSTGFIYYVGGKKAPQGIVLLSRVLNVVLAGLLALVLLGVLHGGDSHLLNLPYAYLAVISAGIVLAQSVFLAANKEWRMWWFLAALTMMAPFLVGLANYPYLIYPDILL